jgi:hypothetical protein
VNLAGRGPGISDNGSVTNPVSRYNSQTVAANARASRDVLSVNAIFVV